MDWTKRIDWSQPRSVETRRKVLAKMFNVSPAAVSDWDLDDFERTAAATATRLQEAQDAI